VSDASAARYLVVDVGSTTSKAILIGWRDGRFRLIGRAEAPTTVEPPVADVMGGVRAALTALGQQTDLVLLDDNGDIRVATAAGTEATDTVTKVTDATDNVADRNDAEDGDTAQPVSALLATSSAAGGLQMLVMGLVREMTAASAEQAALGAGAIVSDVIAFDDAASPAEQLARLRRIRPDMVLLAGGTDGGARSQVVALAELIAAAEIGPRHGAGELLPVIFAGNRRLRRAILATLAHKVSVSCVDNIRPSLEVENLRPARERIHEVFLEHVMAHAPGYAALQEVCAAPVLPTPAACGLALGELAARSQGLIVAIDLGGATTDVFSARGDDVRRTVSANLGLSYSIGNVCYAAGWERVVRWLPFTLPRADLRNRIRNKMFRPTTVPASAQDVWIEQAVAREAVRLALVQHRTTPVRLSGARREQTIAARLRPDALPDESLDLAEVSLLIGSGGGMAHAPRRVQTAALLVDACRPEGVTALAMDAEFLLPHLGQLGNVAPVAAAEVLQGDCLVHLGSCVAPVGDCDGEGVLAQLQLRTVLPDDERREGELAAGDLWRWQLPQGQSAELLIRPSAGIDFGAGPGVVVETLVTGGDAGVIFDGRGRSLPWPSAELARRQLVRRWYVGYGLLEGDAS